MRMYVTAIATLALGTLLAGCSGSAVNYDSMPPPLIFADSVFVKDGDAYVAGSQLNDRDDNLPAMSCAALWKNGEVCFLSKDPLSYARSVFVSGANVYVAGFERKPETNFGTATLWINGFSHYLDIADFDYSHANSVFVSGEDVYVLGGASNAFSGKKFVVVLWKNGVPQCLTDGTRHAYPGSLFVSGKDVYVMWTEQNPDGKTTYSGLWKNNVKQEIGTDCALLSAFVSGEDLYLCGYDEEGLLTLWKNNVKQVYGTEKIDASIGYFPAQPVVFVSGADVYVLGHKESRQLGYWKNGEWHFLVNGAPPYKEAPNYTPTHLHSIFVSGGDVYVTGQFDFHVPALWKNGVMQLLQR